MTREPRSSSSAPTRHVPTVRRDERSRSSLQPFVRALRRTFADTLLLLALACSSSASPDLAGATGPAPDPVAAASAASETESAPDTDDAPDDASTDPPATSTAEPALPLRGGSLKRAVAVAELPWPPPEVTVHIDKADRRMRVRSGSTDLVDWRIALGGTNADKVRQGDRATPEGRFRVVTRNERSRFHLFLGLSYPTADDADRGLRDGLITPVQATRIRQADGAGRTPPWQTPLGGAIGLHGGGGGADWTLGCIAVENAQIEELWEAAPLGTVVTIGP